MVLGPGLGFFERTIAMTAERGPEERSKHWFGNSRVSVKGDRASSRPTPWL